MRRGALLSLLTLIALPAPAFAQEMYPPSVWQSAGTERATNAEITQWVAALGPNIEHRNFGCIPPPQWGEGSPADEAAGHLVRVGASSVNFVLPLLREKDPKRRRIAAEILGRIGSKRAVPALVQAYPLEDDMASRESVVESLAMLTDYRAEDTLLTALNDRLNFIQADAAMGLGRLKSTRAIEPLIALLRRQTEPRQIGFIRSPDIAQAAANALTRIGPPAFPPLLDLLNEPNISPFVLTPALTAANTVGDRRIVPALIRLLDHSDDTVSAAAAGALAKWNDLDSIAPLRHALRRSEAPVLYAAANTLAVMGGKDALAVVFAAVADPDPALQRAGTAALLYLHDRRAIPQLIGVLENGFAESRPNAAATLGALIDARALPALIAATAAPDVALRRNAVGALQNYSSPEATTALLKVLDDPNPGVLNQAIPALQNRTDPRILPALRKMEENPDGGVQESVRRALKIQAQMRH